MTWFTMSALGHHGYPQPDTDYDTLVYSETCVRCGIHGPQKAPFRVRPFRRATHSHFLQLNWAFDQFFVLPDVAEALESAAIRGISFGPVIDHRTGRELPERRQLRISTVVPGADTERLPSVTCKPKNEESHIRLGGGPLRYPPDAPYCYRVKHHPPNMLVFNPVLLDLTVDILQTEEWFGSGGSAFRHTLVSEGFVDLVRARDWRGIEFREAPTIGHSELVIPTRAT
jgi:hypothetical protein